MTENDPTLHVHLTRNGEHRIFRIRRSRRPVKWIFVLDHGVGSVLETGEVDHDQAARLKSEFEVEIGALRKDGWLDV